MGLVSRLNPGQPSNSLWLVLVVGALGVWVWRARQAIRAKDEVAGLALTGIIGCLISPITWIHHLVWVVPAIVLLFDHAFDPARVRRERRNMLIFAVIAYAILSSRLVWVFAHHFGGFGLLGSNAYVLLLVVLLFTLPIRTPTPAASAIEGSAAPTVEDVPDLVDIDRRVTAAFSAKEAVVPVEDKTLVGAR
jgi:alpha-1,2-mannosyltransferase